MKVTRCHQKERHYPQTKNLLKCKTLFFPNNLVFEPWGRFQNMWSVDTRADWKYLPTFPHLLTEPNYEHTLSNQKTWNKMIPSLQGIYTRKQHTKLCITTKKYIYNQQWWTQSSQDKSSIFSACCQPATGSERCSERRWNRKGFKRYSTMFFSVWNN